MKKKPVVASASNPVDSVVAKLRKAQEKRDIRFANRYIIYGYKTDGYYTPNAIVLPKSSEAANPFFIAENFDRLVKAHKGFKVPNDLVLVRLAEFNLQSGKIDSLPIEIVYHFNKDSKEDR